MLRYLLTFALVIFTTPVFANAKLSCGNNPVFEFRDGERACFLHIGKSELVKSRSGAGYYQEMGRSDSAGVVVLMLGEFTSKKRVWSKYMHEACKRAENDRKRAMGDTKYRFNEVHLLWNSFEDKLLFAAGTMKGKTTRITSKVRKHHSGFLNARCSNLRVIKWSK